MKLVDLTCNHCGALLTVDADKKQATCNYCGTTLLIDEGVQHIQYDNAEEAGYNFEKGRQRALAEARQAQINSIRMQAQQGHAPNQPSKAKRGTCWEVFLWVCFFPIMLTIVLIKTDKLKWHVKIVLIILLWLFFIACGKMNNNSNKTDTDAPSTSTEVNEAKTNAETDQLIAAIEKGEGIRMADSGKSAPQYVNVIGYAVADYNQNYELEHTDNFRIPTYGKNK
ncbi:MAG: hypothetical protein K2O57_07810 [Acetatifactor sp.]|nr:hypothetical protein [Acetatifactor sp.]